MNSLSEIRDEAGEPGSVRAPLLVGQLPGQVRRLQFEQVDCGVKRVAAGVEVQAKALLEAKVAQLNSELNRLRPQLVDELHAEHALELAGVREEYERSLQQEILRAQGAVREACDRFRLDRERYFAMVEVEVVKLSLAIAARVLHRESSLDPMLLQATVRVALGKVADESGTVVRVPEGTEQGWTAALRLDMDESVSVVGDTSLAPGECVLSTRLGRVELGVAAQLAEIEHGFFDLLQQRPG